MSEADRSSYPRAMPTSPHNQLLPSLPSPARMQVARFRGALDWMIAHPKWEDHLVCSLNELGFKGQRQGINQRSALRALPIEQKQELLRHGLEQGLPTPSFAEAKRLARNWGVTQYRARSDFGRPSQTEWLALQKKVLIRICARYEQYKESQSELFSQYQHLPVEGALAHCSSPSQREDACQEARLALLESIDRIEPNAHFEAYARQWIKRRILNFLMQERVPVKAPINLISKSFRGKAGASPILKKAIREGTVQLDNPLHANELLGDSLTSEPCRSPQRAAMRSDEIDRLNQALSALTPKQREVVERRFGLGDTPSCQSLSQIAAGAGISRQQIFQREKRALQALKSKLLQLEPELQFEPAGASGY